MSVWHNYFWNTLFVRGFSSNWDYPIAIDIINLRREAQIHRSLLVNTGLCLLRKQVRTWTNFGNLAAKHCLCNKFQNKTKTENSNEERIRSALFCVVMSPEIGVRAAHRRIACPKPTSRVIAKGRLIVYLCFSRWGAGFHVNKRRSP
jgi:hypothetical protein